MRFPRMLRLIDGTKHEGWVVGYEPFFPHESVSVPTIWQALLAYVWLVIRGQNKRAA